MAKRKKQLTWSAVNQLCLVDQDGRTRGLLSLGGDDSLPFLQFYGADGSRRLTIGLDKFDIPYISLYHANGRVGLGMRVTEDGMYGIEVSGPEGRPSVSVGIDFNGEPSILVFDREGNPVELMDEDS